MPILPSAGKRIQELLRQLESPVAARRESAVARLTLLGSQSISHLPGFLIQATAPGRQAALDLLERLGETRGLEAVLRLTQDPSDDVARRAMEVAAAFPDPRAAGALQAALSSGSLSRRRAAAHGLGRLHRLGLVEAVEPLLDCLLDGDEDEALRLGVLESLSSLDRRSLRPALRALVKDASPAVGRAAAALLGSPPGDEACEPASPAGADVATLLAKLMAPDTSKVEVSRTVEALVEQRSPAHLPLLGRRLEALSDEAGATGTQATARSKARIHLALGALGSRIALHDLREMLRARPLYAVHDLLAAADLVGDASLVPTLAALAADEPALAPAAAPVFQTIARREKLRRTSRVVTGLSAAHKAALEGLWPPQRSAGGASRERNRKLR